jgi:endonuclease/exonuclease/phosphatase family metal-dependent hydrolase
VAPPDSRVSGGRSPFSWKRCRLPGELGRARHLRRHLAGERLDEGHEVRLLLGRQSQRADLAREPRIRRAAAIVEADDLGSRAQFPRGGSQRGRGQVEELRREFRGYEGFFAAAVDIPGRNGRRHFGNVILSRLPVGRVLRHQLPWPALPDERSMPRAVVEVVVEAPFGPLRVMTTHLEYYSKTHRAAQIARLAELHAEARAPHLEVKEPGSYESYERGASAIVCGDFNLKPEDPAHRQMLDAGFVDAWQPAQSRQAAPGHLPFARRRAAVLLRLHLRPPDLVPRLRSFRIDAETQASDHQPMVVEFS